jgi:hypothetical protein
VTAETPDPTTFGPPGCDWDIQSTAAEKASRQRWFVATAASSRATVSGLPPASVADQTVPT